MNYHQCNAIYCEPHIAKCWLHIKWQRRQSSKVYIFKCLQKHSVVGQLCTPMFRWLHIPMKILQWLSHKSHITVINSVNSKAEDFVSHHKMATVSWISLPKISRTKNKNEAYDFLIMLPLLYTDSCLQKWKHFIGNTTVLKSLQNNKITYDW